MGLTEDFSRLVSLCLSQSDKIIEFARGSFDHQVWWDGSSLSQEKTPWIPSGGSPRELWLTVLENQFPNLREEQQL